VQKSAEIALDRVPVYTLPDNFKGHVARMALSSVEVKDGTVIAHLSFIQFTGMVLTYLALGAATILIAVFLVVAAANGVALPFIFL